MGDDKKFVYESLAEATEAANGQPRTTEDRHGPSTSKPKNFSSSDSEGGYGYVVVFAAFMTQFIVDGIAYSYGIISLELEVYFSASAFATSFVGSILCAVYLITAILAAVLVDRYGYRSVTIAGSLIAAFGFGLSTLVTTIGALMVTFGVIGGVGLGLIYLPGIVAVANYFRIRRSFMMGVTVAGSGFGNFVLAPFFSFLLPEMGWKYSAVILAGISLNGCVFGALMRPLPKPPKERTENPDRRKNGLDRVKERLRNRKSSAQDATLTSVWEDGKLEKVRLEKEERLRLEEDEEEAGDKEMRYLNGILPIRTEDDPSEFRSVEDNSSGTAAGRRKKSLASRTSSLISMSMLHLSVPVDLVKDGATLKRGKLPVGSSGLASYLRRSLRELRWLFGPLCVIPCVANFVAMIGLYIPFYFITQRALQLDVNKTQAAFLLSVIAISNTVGRFVLGFVAGLNRSAPLVIHNVSLVSGGVACILSMFCVNYWLSCIYAVYFGLCVAGWISLTSVILCDLLGEEKLALSFGVLNLMRGISTVIGPPIAGLVYDWTRDYNNSFHVGGVMMTTGGIICCFLHLPSLQRKSHDSQLQQQQQLGSSIDDNTHA